MNGFIKLYRSLIDNPLWSDKPFSKGQAWVDLLMMTNWKDSDVKAGNEIRTIHRGEIGVSQKWLADRWGWSRKKVCFFLKYLEREKMIAVLGTSKGTTIRIENYTKFNDDGTADGTSEEHQKSRACTHINNIKNSNKEEELLQRESKEKVSDILKRQHEAFALIKEAIMQ